MYFFPDQLPLDKNSNLPLYVMIIKTLQFNSNIFITFDEHAVERNIFLHKHIFYLTGIICCYQNYNIFFIYKSTWFFSSSGMRILNSVFQCRSDGIRWCKILGDIKLSIFYKLIVSKSECWTWCWSLPADDVPGKILLILSNPFWWSLWGFFPLLPRPSGYADSLVDRIIFPEVIKRPKPSY